MNYGQIKLQPIIQEYNEFSHLLDILYIFTDLDIIPSDDPLGLSPHLLEMYRHIWRDAVRMGLELSIAAGIFTDAKGATIILEETYWLDYLIPSGMIPNNMLALASVIDVDGFLNKLNPMYIFTSFHAIYKGDSVPRSAVPDGHRKVPGVGISPYNDEGGWWVPALSHLDFDEGSLLLGFETHTPQYSGYSDWYNAGGRMFCLFHPALSNALLRSNLPHTGYGVAAESAWTKNLLSTNEDYPACIPPYSIYSADVNAHINQIYCESMGLIPPVTPNHTRGAWASYDWTSSVGSLWSHSNHGTVNCPYACELCHRKISSYGDNRAAIEREWALHSYGRPGTRNRDLYAFAASPPATYFPDYQAYMFLDGLTRDLVSPGTVVSEWDATGAYYVSLSHYGGLVGSTRYADMILLDRANYFLSAAGITGGGVFSAPPIHYTRHYRHTGNQRDGALYLLGRKIPDDYTVFYRPVRQRWGAPPLLPLPVFQSMPKAGIDLLKDPNLPTALQYHTEPVGYDEEELNYL